MDNLERPVRTLHSKKDSAFLLDDFDVMDVARQLSLVSLNFR